ncbi:hypothetical protein CPB83DRAFT_756369 [Crepidotus variabilis]|uniref:MARVEL domain-containing protein n=1 Tax=Crepidotus variabilis TaxID=179855 RepID=A0A9P6ESP6_9AGAR|nr:hypothetical protein CPB83DRAFT_756369 [Crepidotus variabilis]
MAGSSGPLRTHHNHPTTTSTSANAATASANSQRAVRSKMPNLFSTIRASIYGTVLLFTVICVAMAGHFQAVLAASDLTRFVPFAIFVCSASLFIFVILLAFSFLLKGRNPISTRIELACLGLAGLFWLILGVYLTTSDAQSADVQCFSGDQLEVPLDEEIADFHTDQYQAMYRVLNAFSLMNAALVIFACFSLLFLAFRRHRKGDEHMWHGPVTSCAWFGGYEGAKLARGKSTNSSILPIAAAESGQSTEKQAYTEKPERKASGRRDYTNTRQESYNNRSRGGDRQLPIPPVTKYTSQGRPTRHGSGHSSRSGQSALPDLENGGMLNPYSRPARTYSSRR